MESFSFKLHQAAKLNWKNKMKTAFYQIDFKINLFHYNFIYYNIMHGSATFFNKFIMKNSSNKRKPQVTQLIDDATMSYTCSSRVFIHTCPVTCLFMFLSFAFRFGIEKKRQNIILDFHHLEFRRCLSKCHLKIKRLSSSLSQRWKELFGTVYTRISFISEWESAPKSD